MEWKHALKYIIALLSGGGRIGLDRGRCFKPLASARLNLLAVGTPAKKPHIQDTARHKSLSLTNVATAPTNNDTFAEILVSTTSHTSHIASDASYICTTALEDRPS